MLLPGALTLAAGCVAGYVYTADPNVAGTWYPPCPFLTLTGLWCPGCGSARALHALLHLDLGTALARNPLAVVVYGYVLVAFLAWTRRRVTGAPRRLAAPWVTRTVLVGVVLFWILRNLPGMTWLSPA
ncbi:MAG TPA: DUF2752 domain-containing protein [Dermatophilaceae bacterium]|nr:DUF2752 domain-containing protein [Dermatophilaceae bacterium]